MQITTARLHKNYPKQKILVLCMLPHSSYLLQLPDVGCFASLKRAYYAEIENWSLDHASQERNLLTSFLNYFWQGDYKG